MIIDPAMGSAGFLIESQKFIRDKYESELMKADGQQLSFRMEFFLDPAAYINRSAIIV